MGLKDLILNATGMSSDPKTAKTRLVNLVMAALTDKKKRIRSEDAITLISTIVAERCIDLAGQYPLRDHEHVPGSRVFSEEINGILYGESAEGGLDSYPSDSVVGMLRDQLTPGTYQMADFPPVKMVLENFAAGIGKAEDWGTVPLTVPLENRPTLVPLKFGYATRPQVDGILNPLKVKKEALRVSVMALSELLKMVRGAIDPKVALLLSLEILNGMAKTAPMTERAMKGVQEKTGI